jgi:hypothetical protein
MRIEIPHSVHPITRLNVTTPQGLISADFTQVHKFFDVELPEGVTEDEVGVEVQYLNNGNKAVDGLTLKFAIEKPAEPVIEPAADEDCECGDGEACSNCDPEDEIADPKDDASDV